MEDRKRSSMVVKPVYVLSNQAGHSVNQFSFVLDLFSQYSQDRNVHIDTFYIVVA